jgi:hypothetical protein
MIDRMKDKEVTPVDLVKELREKFRSRKNDGGTSENRRSLATRGYDFFVYICEQLKIMSGKGKKIKIKFSGIGSVMETSQLSQLIGRWVPTPADTETDALRKIIKQNHQAFNKKMSSNNPKCLFCGDSELACIVCSTYRCCFFKACGAEGDDIQCHLCDLTFHRKCLEEHLGPMPPSQHVFSCGYCLPESASTPVDGENFSVEEPDSDVSAGMDQSDSETMGKCKMSKIKHYHM